MMEHMEARLAALLNDDSSISPDIFQKAGEIIRSGGLVAFPTETVYGLGANALDAEAVKKIYLAKGRPSDNPLILHVSSLAMAESVVDVNWRARCLMDKFWPGPLSLVLKAKNIVPLSTRGGLSTAAVRMPDNSTALKVIQSAGVPIAAPSANKSGRPSPTDARTVADDIGDAVALVIDGGLTRVGLESAVLDITGENAVLLRPGGVSKEMLEEALKEEVLFPQDRNIIKRSPGTRYRHYAPAIPLKLSDPEKAEELAEGRKWAWIGTQVPQGIPFVKIIFSDEDEYAKELFRVLRTIEKSGAELIIAQKPLSIGIGPALYDRLIRASGI